MNLRWKDSIVNNFVYIQAQGEDWLPCIVPRQKRQPKVGVMFGTKALIKTYSLAFHLDGQAFPFRLYSSHALNLT